MRFLFVLYKIKLIVFLKAEQEYREKNKIVRARGKKEFREDKMLRVA